MALDINTVSAEELATATGMQPEIASAICEYRDENGGFMDIAEVADVPGVDEATMTELAKAGVKVGSPADTDGGVM